MPLCNTCSDKKVERKVLKEGRKEGREVAMMGTVPLPLAGSPPSWAAGRWAKKSAYMREGTICRVPGNLQITCIMTSRPGLESTPRNRLLKRVLKSGVLKWYTTTPSSFILCATSWNT